MILSNAWVSLQVLREVRFVGGTLSGSFLQTMLRRKITEHYGVNVADILVRCLATVEPFGAGDGGVVVIALKSVFA